MIMLYSQYKIDQLLAKQQRLSHLRCGAKLHLLGLFVYNPDRLGISVSITISVVE